jgi:LacI family sucrose operon transcriptional repressor
MDCQLDLNNTLGEIEDEFYDFLIVADWLPEDAKRLSRGCTIGLDNWKDIQTDCVIETDHHKGGEMAGRYLWQQGCRKVAYWDNNPIGSATLRALPLRRLGFMKGWVESGGRLEDIKDYQIVQSRSALKQMVVEASKEVDGIFAFCDHVALDIWDILDELGIRVPQDIMLMGYDGNYEAFQHNPPLTTIRQPCKEIAEAILEVMVNAQNGDVLRSPKTILVSPELIQGHSA